MTDDATQPATRPTTELAWGIAIRARKTETGGLGHGSAGPRLKSVRFRSPGTDQIDRRQ